MAARLEIKNSFSGGELAPEFHARSDLKAFGEGMAQLKNVFVLPGGGVKTRPGTEKTASLGAISDGERCRLAEFVSARGERFTLVIRVPKISIYDDNGALLAAINRRIAEPQLLQFVRIEEGLLFVHPNYQPQLLTAVGTADSRRWRLTPWQFNTVTDETTKKVYPLQPFYRFAPPGVTLQCRSDKRYTDVTCSVAYFTRQHVGLWLRYRHGMAKITKYYGPTKVMITYYKNLGASVLPSADWSEQAFSDLRGWPSAACLHRGRLCFGGSEDSRNWLWLSKAADYRNFTPFGERADEAMSFGLAEAVGEKITALASGQHLQVFTDKSEWVVGGEPFTNENLQLRRYSKVGSATVPPVEIEGNLFFLSATREQIREFYYENVQNAYKAEEISAKANHILRTVCSMAYDRKRKILFCVRDDGKMAALTVLRNRGIFACSNTETEGGKFIAVGNIGGEIYLLVNRGGEAYLERFNDECLLDHSTFYQPGQSRTVYLSAIQYALSRNGLLRIHNHDSQTLSQPHKNAASISVGSYLAELGTTIKAEMKPLPLPDEHLRRIIKIRLRFINSRGMGFAAGGIETSLTPMRKILNPDSSEALYPVSGEVELFCAKDSTPNIPPWRIYSDSGDLNFTLLSITMKTEVRQ